MVAGTRDARYPVSEMRKRNCETVGAKWTFHWVHCVSRMRFHAKYRSRRRARRREAAGAHGLSLPALWVAHVQALGPKRLLPWMLGLSDVQGDAPRPARLQMPEVQDR